MNSALHSRTHSFGFLPYIKPYGMTSRELVNRVQRRLRRELNDRKLKVGHTGTLDPLADGLVVIAVGAAARLTPWMLQHAKRYVARFELGVSSTSGDLEEPIVALADAPQPTMAEIQIACDHLHGWIDQTPPGHSAIWIDGERAHQRMRRGEQFEMPTRRVWIDSIKVTRYEYPHLDVDVRCGSGTYLRSLGMDIAARCQSVAVMTKLTRSEVGPFEIASAVGTVPPDDPPPMNREQLAEGLSPMAIIGDLRQAIQAPVVGLAHLPSMHLDSDDVERLRHGLPISGEPQMPSQQDLGLTGARAESLDRHSGEASAVQPVVEECIAKDGQGDLVAVLRIKRGLWAPYRVFAPSR
ncbi:tRNA pseudouridine(55) synthase TruB [Allorhodopirellula heiligendammensis]|uniref:tRNA pseudouridine synthase B n=1 Tax=Allorhodopirellula heiligendammensis TaxID=2714739 RepID=A0A5C6BEQ2_9BACT|nr:tRNA pseudouridine(55) synthase TruB [Allorhodopirellula heiligendammensis]TWU10603.1 tRNA pseudouridine synthase B [Allorhodopirellula heiligendammensis]